MAVTTEHPPATVVGTKTFLPNTYSRNTESGGISAFFIGRLERDFDHARNALAVAVERCSGWPLLWSDDGRHRTNIAGIRDRTAALLEHASLVVADMTLGPEGPYHTAC